MRAIIVEQKMKKYELIEHTADIGIRVKGGDLKKLFKNAASAMFDIMAEKKPTAKSQELRANSFIVEQKAENLEELLINWLNELLSLSATKGIIFNEFIMDKLDKSNLKAKVSGCDIKNYKINTEIKAATYHALKIEEKNSNWQTEVIFDV